MIKKENKNKENKTNNDLLIHYIKENNSIRKKQFFIRVFIILLIVGTIIFSSNRSYKEYDNYHTAVIKINDIILPSKQTNAENIIKSLKKAYSNRYVKGIILEINSPGGSAIESEYIFKEIIRLKKKNKNIPIYSSIKGMGTSAAYLISCATNKIYANKISVVGSIGVLIDSFGFHDLLNKVGVERRLLTSGKFKGLLYPYSRMSSEQKKIIQYQLKIVHKNFIKNVIKSRRDKLKISPLIFSGLSWLGEDAFNIGLIDGFGDTLYISKELIKTDSMIDYTINKNLFDDIKDRTNLIFNNQMHSLIQL